MQGKKVQLTPQLERRILAAMMSDEKPSHKVLTRRFGMSRYTLWEIKRKASQNKKVTL